MNDSADSTADCRSVGNKEERSGVPYGNTLSSAARSTSAYQCCNLLLELRFHLQLFGPEFNVEFVGYFFGQSFLQFLCHENQQVLNLTRIQYTYHYCLLTPRPKC